MNICITVQKLFLKDLSGESINFRLTHKVLYDRKFLPYIGSFCDDSTIFQLYKISKYHYPLLAQQELHNTYNINDIKNNEITQDLQIRNLKLSESESSLFLVMCLYSKINNDVESIKILFEHLLSEFEPITEQKDQKDQKEDWKENQEEISSNISTIADKYLAEFSTTHKLMINILNHLQQLEIPEIPYPSFEQSNYFFMKNMFERGIKTLVFDPNYSVGLHKMLAFNELEKTISLEKVESKTEILGINHSVFLREIRFTSLVELTLSLLYVYTHTNYNTQKLRAALLNPLLLESDQKNQEEQVIDSVLFYSDIAGIKTLRKLDLGSIIFTELDEPIDILVEEKFTGILPKSLTCFSLHSSNLYSDKDCQMIKTEIESLTELEKLSIYGNNNYSEHKIDLSRFKKLKTLWIPGSLLMDVPNTVTKLSVEENFISFFPNLSNLTELYISGQNIPELYPNNIQKLTIITRRKDLNLNLIKDVLPTSLRELIVNNIYGSVHIGYIPTNLIKLNVTAQVIYIGKFNPGLRELYLSMHNPTVNSINKLDEFPRSLDRIEIEYPKVNKRIVEKKEETKFQKFIGKVRDIFEKKFELKNVALEKYTEINQILDRKIHKYRSSKEGYFVQVAYDESTNRNLREPGVNALLEGYFEEF